MKVLLQPLDFSSFSNDVFDGSFEIESETEEEQIYSKLEYKHSEDDYGFFMKNQHVSKPYFSKS